MQQVHQRQHRGRDEGHTDKAVRNAAMVLQPGDGALESPDDVDVSSLGGQHHGHRRQLRFAIKARATHAGAGKKMRDRIQESPVPGFAGQQIYRVRKDFNNSL